MSQPNAKPTSQSVANLLQEHNKTLAPISQLVSDPQRFSQRQHRFPGLFMDASRTQVDTKAWQLLLQFAAAQNINERIQALFAAEEVNYTERRPALHMALRAEHPEQYLNTTEAKELTDSRQRLLEWAADFHAGHLPGQPEQKVQDIIHIGIGGSDLGSRMLAAALPSAECQPRLHFISAPDPHQWQSIISQADPAHSAIIITTKSFSTVETLTLAAAARDWMGTSFPLRSYAVTAATEKAAKWVNADHILPMWPWVGGRFSVWSGAGIMGAIAIGASAFEALLQGAAKMDEHFSQQAISQNLPIAMAAYDYWHHNVQNYPTRGVFVYDQRLRLVPEWLKQLEMESLGKQIRDDGSRVDTHTAPMIVGGSGPDAQHAIFQALHQGTRPWPMELITATEPDPKHHAQHHNLRRLQWASMLAQAQALTHGNQSSDDPARQLPGQRPVQSWLLEGLSPENLGALLAAYEHKVYVLACLWNINAFDQWGVEEGKRIAHKLLHATDAESAAADPTTQQWLNALNWWR